MLLPLLMVSSVLAALPDIDAPLKVGARAEADSAVVIGIEDYFVLPDVPHARRDAEAFYRFLVYTRGVPAPRVQLLDRGANRERILAAVEDASAQAAPGGTVWVYFAGHGAASPADGARLLLGDDVRPDLDSFQARAVPVDLLGQLAGASGADVNLILDTCYTGADRAGGELIVGKRFAVPAAPPRPPVAVLEWTAASAGEWSGPLEAARHGAFTYFVIGALRGWADGQLSGERDGRVTAEEASLYVTEALRAVQVHDQTPVLTVEAPHARVLVEGVAEAGPMLDATGPRPLPPPSRTPPASGAVAEDSPAAVDSPAEDSGRPANDAMMADFLTNRLYMPKVERARLLEEARTARADFVAGSDVASARARLEAMPGVEERLHAISAFSGWSGGGLTRGDVKRAYGAVVQREPGKLGTSWFGPPREGDAIRAVGVGFAASVVELRALPAVVEVLRGAGQSLDPLGVFGLSEEEARALLGEPRFDGSAGGTGYPSLVYVAGPVRITLYLTGDGGEVHALSVNYPDG